MRLLLPLFILGAIFAVLSTEPWKTENAWFNLSIIVLLVGFFGFAFAIAWAL